MTTSGTTYTKGPISHTGETYCDTSLEITDHKEVLINNCIFKNFKVGPALSIKKSGKVEIKNSFFQDSVLAKVDGKDHCKDSVICLENVSEVTIDGCTFKNLDFVRALRINIADHAVIIKNKFSNCSAYAMNIANINGAESLLEISKNCFHRIGTAMYIQQSSGIDISYNKAIGLTKVLGTNRSAFVQLGDCKDTFLNIQTPDQITQYVGIRVVGNAIMNDLGSVPSDIISIHGCEGTATPIIVESNTVLGDCQHGSRGFSISGAGIIIGDGGGENVICHKNVLINPGHIGITVAGGGGMLVYKNILLGEEGKYDNVQELAFALQAVNSEIPRFKSSVNLLGGNVNIVENYVDWWDNRHFYDYRGEQTGQREGFNYLLYRTSDKQVNFPKVKELAYQYFAEFLHKDEIDPAQRIWARSDVVGKDEQQGKFFYKELFKC